MIPVNQPVPLPGRAVRELGGMRLVRPRRPCRGEAHQRRVIDRECALTADLPSELSRGYSATALVIAARTSMGLQWSIERVMGIEPTLAAWEAAVLPLNYTRRLVIL
jgi:hypothetical protein